MIYDTVKLNFWTSSETAFQAICPYKSFRGNVDYLFNGALIFCDDPKIKNFKI